ncbi:MAG: hypothetical protein M3324_03895 [Actinomycetota bacterium]|jgi:hypothetical protein|nr:hypothetical protein [Actinomycetota bacterium]
MSASIPSSMRTEEWGGVNGFFAEALWLARKEMKRAWLSHPLSGLFVLSLGLFAVPSLSGVFEVDGSGAVGLRVEDHYNDFIAGYLFLVVGAFLSVSAISRDYTLAAWQDTYLARLLFMRELPISPGSLVASRVISMLFALILYAPAFFLPAFFLSDLGELGTSKYLYFCGVWIGYGLLGSGLCLLLELTVNGKLYILISVGFTVTLMAVLALLEWIVDVSLVGRTAQLGQSYGAPPAIISLLAGGAALALLSRLTVRRIAKRNLSA